MNIVSDRYTSPDDTYFTTDAAQPEIQEDGSIGLVNGRGRSRGWGSPQVTSTIVLNESDFCAIHVGYSHKHRGGQFWRYFAILDGQTVQRSWAQLSDETRQQVLDAAKTKAPSWANIPGKLRSEAERPTTTRRLAYKLVERRDDGALVSLFDGSTVYTIGEELHQTAKGDHEGGYYVHDTPGRVMELWGRGELVPDQAYRQDRDLVLLECECWGRMLRYDNQKLAASYLKPVRIVKEFHYSVERSF